MIHYTLLPEQQMKGLRKEYRARIFIVLLFFISCGIIVGIISLSPSYILSYHQEKEALNKLELLKKSRVDNGSEAFSRELAQSADILNKLRADHDPVIFSDLVNRVIVLKNKSVSLSSFEVAKAPAESPGMQMIVQGKALTRESLLEFKKRLEQDAGIAKVELPLSDLAKSKSLSFGLKISFK